MGISYGFWGKLSTPASRLISFKEEFRFSLPKPSIGESERTAQLQNLFGVNSSDWFTFAVPTT